MKNKTKFHTDMSIVTKILKNFQIILVCISSILLRYKKFMKNNIPAMLNIKEIKSKSVYKVLSSHNSYW